MDKKDLEFAQKLQKHLDDTQQKLEYHFNRLKEFLEELYLKN